MEDTKVPAMIDGEEVDRYEEETGRNSFNTEDKYDEYMIIKGQLELIGSGSYQRIRQDIEAITGYDILHNWDATTLNENEDGVHTLNNRLNRDVEIFKAVTGYDYLDSKSNNEVTTESIDAKVQQIDKANINGDNINSRLNRDREIFKAVTGYVYDDEEDNVPVTKDEIAQHVEDTDKTVITGDSINARINRDREILKAITGYENYEDEIDDKTSLLKQISDDVQKDGGSVKEVVRGITGYVYDKDPSKDDAEADIKTVVENITGYTFHKDSSVKTNGGNISEVVSAITGYKFNTDLTDDNNCSIKGKVEDITGYDYDTSASAQGGTVREVVKAITGYEFNKSLTETDNDDKNLSIHTRIVNEIADRIADVNAEETRATTRENDIVKKLTTITGYDFSEDLTAEGGNIDTRIDNEIKDRTNADTLIRETVASITGYDFDKDVTTEGGNIHTRIVNEITRATAAEGTLDNKIDDTKTALQKEIDADVKVETDRAIAKETELNNTIITLTDTITELRKNIVILELDKGYQITAPTIEASYEEGTLSTASLKDFSITSENLVLGDNEVAVKFSGFDIEGVEYPFNVEHNFNVIVDDFGEVKFENPVIIPVEITDTITKPEVDEETGDIIQIETTVPVILGSITLDLTGNHKKQTLGINYNIESVSYDTNNEPV